MTNFKFVINEPETRKSFQLEVDQGKAIGLIGKKIGEEFNGDLVGLSGYSLKITGGSDKEGFPMHPSIRGPGRKRILISSAPGFHPKIKGERKRKTVRGDTISDSIVQVNVKVVKKGEKSLDQLVPMKTKEKKPEEAKEEKPKEEPKKEEKVEKPKEEKPKEEKKPEGESAKEEKK